jgi:hypothetical protein
MLGDIIPVLDQFTSVGFGYGIGPYLKKTSCVRQQVEAIIQHLIPSLASKTRSGKTKMKTDHAKMSDFTLFDFIFMISFWVHFGLIACGFGKYLHRLLTFDSDHDDHGSKTRSVFRKPNPYFSPSRTAIAGIGPLPEEPGK